MNCSPDWSECPDLTGAVPQSQVWTPSSQCSLTLQFLHLCAVMLCGFHHKITTGLSFNSVYMFGFVCVQVRLYMNACRPEINLGCCSSEAIDLRQGISPGPSEAQVPCPATFNFVSGRWGTVQLLMLYGQTVSWLSCLPSPNFLRSLFFPPNANT